MTPNSLTYYVAASLDGFIAHTDGSFGGFAWDDAFVAHYLAELEKFGTVLMGRKTYEVGLREGKTSPYPAMRQVVFSRTMEESPDPAVELVGSGMCAFVRDAKSRSAAPLWLCGGSSVATELLRAGLIDQVVVKLNPVVFGAGIPLLGATTEVQQLTLRGIERHDCGIAVLTYDVVPSPSDSV